MIVNCAGTASWRDLDEVPEADWYAAWELNVMAPMRLMRAALPAMAERGWGRVVNVASTAGKRPSQQMGEYSVAKAGAALALAALRRPLRGHRRARQRRRPRPRQVGALDGARRDARPDRSRARAAAIATRPSAAAGAGRPIGRLARGRRDRVDDRLPLLRAGLLRARSRLERRRRHGSGDHLTAAGPRGSDSRGRFLDPGRGRGPAGPREPERRRPGPALRLARADPG